jgi:hypothetical protein
VRVGVLVVVLAACTPDVWREVDYGPAAVRVPYQTDPSQIAVLETDAAAPYDVLGDLTVVVRQQTSFGDMPTRDMVIAALREQGGRIGAHAIVMVAFGEPGSSWWTWHELRGHGRAVRFR